MTWHKTLIFPKSLLSYWVLAFERNTYWHLEQHSVGIGNAVYWNIYWDICSRLMKHLHWSAVTIMLTWLNYLVWIMMPWNGDFSLTHLTEVSRQLLWITKISSHQSLLGTELKWKNLTKGWNVCCLLNYQENK